MGVFKKLFGGDNEVPEAERQVKHVYMSVGPVLGKPSREEYGHFYFANYRGTSDNVSGFRRQMARKGHVVITSRERFNFETTGGPRGVSGVYLDDDLNPTDRKEAL